MADDNIEPDQASFDKGYSEDANQVNQDDLILQQSKNIEKEISDSIMLVGDKEDIMVLEQQYIGDEVYKGKVKDLARKYSNLRRTRPDGNCFFRSFGFALLESLYHNKSNYERYDPT
ncbi:ubiquitin thioesterase otubain-like [Diaphorina citri]|uniref:ubiquitinyl hydrolase 1 n=1 Tax=Diaphorina citri TaxID=121845 RepID=A0A1S3DH41_DIACI|nr:ubiquitin thioesterase otubain-like [Diaphorina citri]